jgi:hypothetical protein
MNRFSTYLLLAVVGCAVNWSCQKRELPPSTTNNPLYGASFSINGSPVQIFAGRDGSTMQPKMELDSNSVMRYTGVLGNTNTLFSIAFFDLQTNTVGLSNAPAFFTPGPRESAIWAPRRLVNDTTNTFLFTADGINTGTFNYTWYYKSYRTGTADPAFSKVQGPTLEKAFTAVDSAQVALVIRKNGSHNRDSICNVINTRFPNQNVQFAIAVLDTFPDAHVAFTATPGFQNYRWKVSNEVPVFTIQNMWTTHLESFNKQRATVTAVTDQGRVSKFSRFFRVCDHFYPNYPTASFSHTSSSSFQSHWVSGDPNLGRVLLSFQINGKKYINQKSGKQTPGQGIRVTTSQATQPPSSVQGIQKLGLNLDLWLYNAANPSDSIELKTSNCVVAIGYR